MSAPAFAQPERRSFFLPALLAVAALALAVALATHFFPAASVESRHVHTDVLPTHTVFKNDTKLVGVTQAEDVLYVASTVRVINRLKHPVDLDDYALTMTNPEGAELTVKAVDKRDLASTMISFPALVPLMKTPLARDTAVDAGQSVEGTLLFPLQITQAIWDARREATVRVDLYHLPSVYQTIPKDR